MGGAWGCAWGCAPTRRSAIGGASGGAGCLMAVRVAVRWRCGVFDGGGAIILLCLWC